VIAVIINGVIMIIRVMHPSQSSHILLMYSMQTVEGMYEF